jgi:hypothetical protein
MGTLQFGRSWTMQSGELVPDTPQYSQRKR